MRRGRKVLEEIELPRVGGDVEVRGRCFSAVMSGLAKATSKHSARLTQRRAEEVVLNAIKSYQHAFGVPDVGPNGTGKVARRFKGLNVPTGINGLMYGRVQSGKTN